ncbi:MAG TPA: DPP IV N-terminal domain-containing protein, partial [Chthoniobacterales bacterium]|nr:DPP IV N-terminal domain-containing protein [Chthoniobacterales bacterium]
MKFVVLCVAAAMTAASAADSPRVLKPEDFATLRDVDEPNISPDGNSIAYVVKVADMEKDKRPGNLWLAKWDGSENRALTFGLKGQKHPRWSPDGKWLGFLSGREDDNENDQLWVLPIGGGEAEKITDAKGGVDDFAWSPDSKRIALVVHDPDPREPEKKEKEKKTVPPLVIDRFFFKKDIDGYLTQRYSHLQLLDLATRKIDPLTSGKHDDVWPAWSPDGKEIAFVTKRGDDPDRSENWDVWVVAAVPGGKERQLTSSPEADPHPDWDSAPAWSPDGKWIAYLHGGDPKKISYAVHSLAIIPAAGGPAKVLTEKLDRNIFQPHWTPDGKAIYVVVEDDGAQNLVRVPADGGAPAPVTTGRRKVTAYDVSR